MKLKAFETKLLSIFRHRSFTCVILNDDLVTNEENLFLEKQIKDNRVGCTGFHAALKFLYKRKKNKKVKNWVDALSCSSKFSFYVVGMCLPYLCVNTPLPEGDDVISR